MSKQVPKAATSPFDALKIAHLGKNQPVDRPASQTVDRVTGETSGQAAVSMVRSVTKSTDPNYMKFTTYVRKRTHLAVKTRLVSQGRELSDLVEELLAQWLQATQDKA